jgi:hypothetical protein
MVGFGQEDCDCPGCSCTFRNQWALSVHMRECPDCGQQVRALHFIRRQARRRVKRKRPHNEGPAVAADTSQQAEPLLRAASVQPLLPLQWAQIDPLAVFGNERTYVFFKTILHDGGFSHEKASSAISGQLATTSALPEPLLLDPRNGLRDGYAHLDQLAEELGLQFTEHKFNVTLGGRAHLTQSRWRH